MRRVKTVGEVPLRELEFLTTTDSQQGLRRAATMHEVRDLVDHAVASRSPSFEGVEEDTPSSASAHRPPRAGSELPSLEELGRLFDELTKEDDGQLGEKGVSEALSRLSQDSSLCCLGTEDSSLLLAFLGGGSPHVNRDAFARGLRELLGVFSRLNPSLTPQQLKVVLAASFERFDMNRDGVLQVEELQAASEILSLGLSPEDVCCLHRFFAPVDDAPIQQDSIADTRPFWEKWASAVLVSLENMQEHYGLSSIQHCARQIHMAFQREGSLEVKAQSALLAALDSSEALVESVEVVVDLVGLALAMQLAGNCIQGMDGMAGATDTVDFDPLVMFLGLGTVSVVKELDELVPKRMTEDEALLYAQVFHGSGLSQAAYRRLLSCQGCRWLTVAEGEALNTDSNSVRILVRGAAALGAGAARRQLRPGAVLGAAEFLGGRALEGEAAVALEPTAFVEWGEPEHLRECLAHDKVIALHMKKLMVASMLADLAGLEKQLLSKASLEAPFDPLEHARAAAKGNGASDACLISSVRTVLRGHAERKGLSRFCYFARQVMAILEGPGDLDCKARRVLAKLWDGTEDLANFKKALAEVTGTCAAFLGMWEGLSGLTSQDDLVQEELNLLPFLFTLGAGGVHALRHMAKGDVAELSEQEASAYNEVFQDEGFSVADFRRLLRYGDARWEHLDAGRRLPLAGGRLRLLAAGGGRLLRRGFGPEALAPGRLLGLRRLARVDAAIPYNAATEEPELEDATLVACTPCTVLSFDAEALAANLAGDACLQGKVQHLLSAALARRLTGLRSSSDLSLTAPPAWLLGAQPKSSTCKADLRETVAQNRTSYADSTVAGRDW